MVTHGIRTALWFVGMPVAAQLRHYYMKTSGCHPWRHLRKRQKTVCDTVKKKHRRVFSSAEFRVSYLDSGVEVDEDVKARIETLRGVIEASIEAYYANLPSDSPLRSGAE
jgi:hypothetical protein